MRRFLIAAVSCVVFCAAIADETRPGENPFEARGSGGETIRLQGDWLSGLSQKILGEIHPGAPWIGMEEGGLVQPDADEDPLSGALEGWTGRLFSDEDRLFYFSYEQWFMARKRGTTPMGSHQLRRYPKRVPRVDSKPLIAGNMSWRMGYFPGWDLKNRKDHDPKSFFNYVVDDILDGARDRSRYGHGWAISMNSSALFTLTHATAVGRKKKRLEQEYEVWQNGDSKPLACRWSVLSFKAIGNSRKILQATQGQDCWKSTHEDAKERIVRLKASHTISIEDWEEKIGKWPAQDRRFSLGWLSIEDSVPQDPPNLGAELFRFVKQLIGEH